MIPETRSEIFLANIAGEQNELPAPQSRIEHYLNAIAQAGDIHGGSAGAVIYDKDASYPDGSVGAAMQEMEGEISENAGDISQLKSQINEVESGFPQKTASGSIVTIDDGADNVPVVSLTAEINPVQDLHGFDNPWPAGGGKNKLPPILNGDAPSITYGDVTLTIDEQKFKLNGTVTASGGRFDLRTISFMLPAGDYCLSYSPSSSPRPIPLLHNALNNSIIKNDIGNFTLAESTEVFLGLNITGGYIFNNAIFAFQIESGSSSTAWVPYSNECPISGWTGANIYQSGEDTSDPTVIPITFPTEAGTVYGGSLVLNQDGTADLTVNYGIDDLGNLNWIQNVTYGFYSTNWVVNKNAKPVAGTTVPNAICSALQVTYAHRIVGGYGDSEISYIDAVLYARATQYAAPADFKAAMSGQKIVYELATPIVYHIEDIELVKTLYLLNNIWADTGDVSLTYRADPATYIAEQIQTMLNAMVAPVEPTTTASKAYNVNDFLILDNVLYKVIANIANGGTITPNTNVTATTVGEQITAILNY